MGAALKLPTGYTPAADARFRVLLPVEFDIEGGLADNPGDRGGLTNYGVTLRFLTAQGAIDPSIKADFDLDHDGDLDGADVRLLTPETSGDLYRRCLWIRTGYWAVPQRFDGALLDQAINCGVVGANKLLQTAINTLANGKIAVDGVLGTQSTTAVQIRIMQGGGDALMQALREAAMDHYRAICRDDPSQLQWLNGWINRAARLGNV